MCIAVLGALAMPACSSDVDEGASLTPAQGVSRVSRFQNPNRVAKLHEPLTARHQILPEQYTFV